MKKWIMFAVLVTVVSVLVLPVCTNAKTKPKQVKNTTAKVTHYVKGTTQLSGENAQFGITYTLGKASPFNITIKSAEYSVDPIVIGDRLFKVDAKNKLLILHMIYHNPLHADRFVRWDSFGFTAVDANDQNHDGLLDLGAENDKSKVGMSLKPAQKKEVYAAMIVPASGEIPKLMIKSSDNLVLRYDLKGKVKGIPAPFADPADTSGATALAKITAIEGTYYPVSECYFKLDKVEYSGAAAIGTKKLGKNDRLLIVTFSLKNANPQKIFFRWDSFIRKLVDVDGVEVGKCENVFQASRDNPFAGNIEAGQELTLRYAFILPKDVSLKTFSIVKGDGRTLEYDITSIK